MNARRNWLAGGALFFLTLALYWPATDFPFVNYDDQLYVYENPEVLNGLTGAGVRHAATGVVAANWHPLTMLSLMADAALHGTFAGGYHLTNILLHAANAVGLWLLLRQLTGKFWPSALVAALFAWHPLNVESVAWIAERKNVLSTFFFLLTVAAFARYAEFSTAKNPRGKYFYVLALAFFALGLMSKPMLVTLPCVLLLLDFWPLGRISNLNFQAPNLKPLLLEKIPFFILAAADCVVTWLAQHQAGAMKSLAAMPLAARLANIPVAYATYLVKAICPTNLCVLYPYPETDNYAVSVVALIFLAGVTLAACHFWKNCPWLPVGWFWFLGTLVPVIGLVQVGGQAMADRYAYLPLLGVFLIAAFGLNQWLSARPQFRILAVVVVAGFLVFCLMLSTRQLSCWRGGVALFTQAVNVRPQNAVTESFLGRAHSGDGNSDLAVEHFARAVRLRPQISQFQFDLARELVDQKKFAAAADGLAAALRELPDDPALHNLRGVALMLDGKTDAARPEFLRAAGLKPDYANPRFNLGKISLAAGQMPDAIAEFSAALKLQPAWPEAWQQLARARARAGNFSTARDAAAEALRLAQAAGNRPLAAEVAAELKAYQSPPVRK